MSLVDVDPELVHDLPARDLELARRVLTRPRYDVPKGRWAPELLRGHDNGAFAMLVVDGAIVRQLDLAERHATLVLGPGDLLQVPSGASLLEGPVTWTALQPSAVIVLDARFTCAAQRWPCLGLNLQRRLLDQADRLAVHAAISQLPRVDRRIVAFFWQLAERRGRVTPSGVEVPLELTHEAIGRMVGAQRPTVTLALHDLAEAGVLQRTESGSWMLSPDSHELVRAEENRPAAVRRSEADDARRRRPRRRYA